MLDRNDKNIQLEKRIRSVGRMLLIFAGAATIAGIYYAFALAQSGEALRYSEWAVQAFVIAFASIVSYWLLRQKQVYLGVFLFLGVVTVAAFTIVLNYSGMDLLLAGLLMLSYLGIAGTVLPQKVFEPLINLSIFLSILIGFMGYWDPLGREYTQLDRTTYSVILVLIGIFSVFLSRNYSRYSLRTKLIGFFAALSALSVAIPFSFANFNVERVLSENASQRLLAEAESSADGVDSFLQYSQESVETAAAYLDMRAYLLLTPADRKGTAIERQVQNLLYALKNRNPDILSYGLLDHNGIVILDSRTGNVGNNESAYSYFTEPLESSTSYISSVLYLPDEKSGVFFISTPVYNDMGSKIGVLRAKYAATIFQELIVDKASEHRENFTTNAFYVVFDENKILIANEAAPDTIGKLTAQPSAAEFEYLYTQNLLPLDQSVTTSSINFPELGDALTAIDDSPFFDAENLDNDTPYTGAVMALEYAPWTVVALESQLDFTAPVKQQSQFFFILAAGTILLAIFAGSSLANIVAAPILRLQQVAQRFTEGDLTAHAVVETQDEIGVLAETFNTLAERLTETIASLEDRVDERTKDLEVRSHYLQGAAEIGRLATTFVDADKLSQTVVDLIRERFDLYYVGLFLSDDNDEWAVLKAGTGIAGEVMLSNKHRLKIGEGMIGWTVKYGEARIALDVGEDAVRFDNPVLPETRSEGALPLRSRGRVIGAISVQSTESKAFDLESLRTLQTMADQIAVAFDNAQLLKRSEQALEAERRAYGELTLRSWQDMKKRSTGSAFRVDSRGELKTLDESEAEARHQGLGQKRAVQESGRVVLLPIKSRGYVIGGIRIAKPENSGKWTKDQLQLISTISEQLSVALESARLFEDTQMRAQREAVISDISNKVGASIRMDTILKTTVEELGKALSGADISFEITGPDKGAKLKE